MEVNNRSDAALSSRRYSTVVDPSVPLRGVVLCCTSIPPDTRTALAKAAEQMGAQHKYDLTSEVTHLIVGEYDTPKYRYVAKERPDVKVLAVSFIEAVRDLWISDVPIDLNTLETEHTLPTFESLRVCLTGFEDSTERTRIIDLICSNGGEYHGDLTKSITHLVASRPEGKKYKFAKEWKIRLVSLEWLYDSLERGMILDEKLYHPETPPGERGKGAWVRRKVASPLGKRTRETDTVDDGTRKLRRTLSRKLTIQNEVVWGDIVGGGNNMLSGNVNQQQAPLSMPGEDQRAQQSPSSALNDVKRAAFSQCRFVIHGFGPRKTQRLSEHLLSLGGDIHRINDLPAASSSFNNYMVVPHNFAVAELPPTPENMSVVTEWWVERCHEANECLEQSASTFDLPFPHPLVDRFDKLTIASTGFTGFRLLHISKAVALMGAKYEEYFSDKTSVLICNLTQQVRKEKLERAKDWNVPVVSIDWLLESIRTGLKQPYKPYLLRSKVDKAATLRSDTTSQSILKNRTEYDGFETRQDPPLSKSATSQASSRPIKVTRDTTAFHDDDDEPTEAVGGFLIPRKEVAQPTQTPLLPTDNTVKAQPEPLTEISPNSPRKSPISQHRSTTATSSTDTQEISSAITSLLAKSKNPPNSGNSINEGTEVTGQLTGRKPSRILGRAPSNISAVSRASSVDSTASGGQAVHWPAGRKKPLSKADSLSSLAGALMEEEEKMESQPPMTQQLLYEDEEGEKYKAQVIARMAGKEPEKVERAREATLGSLNDSRGRNLRTRDRGIAMR